MMTSTWKAVIGIVLVFILGWFGGALTTMIIARHKAFAMMQAGPEPLARLLERQTTRNLGLNDSQKIQLHTLLVEYLKQRLDLQKQIQPQVRTLNGQTLQQIDAVLTPDQQQHFRDNLVLLKQHYGRNPFNVGQDGKPSPPDAQTPPSPGSETNAPAVSK
jgi:hypothetical protein